MGQQIQVNMLFNAETTQATSKIQSLYNQLGKLSKAGNLNNLSGSMNQVSSAAATLQKSLAASTNMETGKLKLVDFNNQLKVTGMSMSSYANIFAKAGDVGKESFVSLAKCVADAEAPVVKFNSALANVGKTMVSALKWTFAYGVINGITNGMMSAYNYAQKLNSSLNDIRIVTGQSADQMADFAKQANEAAQALSTTTNEYAKASLIYYQQGLDDQEVKERTDVTVKMANVTGDSASTVSEQMTAIWNNFDDGTKSLEYYADAITALGASTASSTDEIANGVQKFASVAETAGLSYEYAAAALATITAETRQSADTVGTGLRTVLSRIESLNLGETLDDDVTLTKYTEALAAIGVSVLDTNGNLKAADDILDSMAEKWANLTEAQKMATAETVGGVRQYTTIMSLMENWDKMQENVQTALGSSGTLEEQQEIYAESWDAAKDRVTAAAEDIYTSIIDDEFFIKVTNWEAEILKGVKEFIDAFGGVKGLLLSVGTLATTLLADKIQPAIDKIMVSISTLKSGGLSGVYKKFSEDINNQISNTISSGNYNIVQEQELRNAVQVLEVKQKISMVNGQLSQSEKQQAEFAVAGIQLQQENLVKLKEEVMNLTEQVDNMRTSMESYVDNTANGLLNNMQSWVLEPNPDVGSDITFQSEDQRNNFLQLYNDDLQNLFTNMQTIVPEIVRLSAEVNSGLNGTISDTDYNNQIQNIYDPIIKGIQTAGAAMKGAITIGTDDSIQEVELCKAKIQSLIAVLPEGVTQSTEFSKALDTITKASYNSSTSSDDVANAINTIINSFKNATFSGKDLLKILEQYNSVNKDGSINLDDFKRHLQQVAQAQGKLASKTNEASESQRKLNNEVKNFKPTHVVTGAQALTSLAASLGGVAMTVNSIKSAVNTAFDPDTSGIEKVSAVLMSISMLVPSVMGVITNFNNVLQHETVVSLANFTAELLKTHKLSSLTILSTAMNSKAIKALGDQYGTASIKVIAYKIQKQLEQKESKETIITSTAEYVARKLNCDQQQAETIVIPIVNALKQKERIARLANVGALILEKAGIEGVKSEFVLLLPVIALAVIAIAGLVFGTKKLIEWLQSLGLTEKSATENIKKAVDAYEEEKEKLDELSDSLEDVKNKIEELESKDTLTLTEKEELDKLKLEEASLERQYELQEKIAKQKQKAAAEKIASQFKTSTRTLQAGDPATIKYRGLETSGGEISKETADEWFARVTENLDESNAKYQDYLVEYEKWISENEQLTTGWLDENQDAYNQAEENIQTYVQAIKDGAIDLNEEELSGLLNILKQIRLSMVGGSEAQYTDTYMKSALDLSGLSATKDSVYEDVADGMDKEVIEKGISDSVKLTLASAGLSVDEFLDYVEKTVTATKDSITDKFNKEEGFDEFFDNLDDNLDADGWEALSEINLDNIDSFKELQNIINNINNSEIKIKTDTEQLEELKTLIDEINEGQDALEKALNSYKENEGYLTADEVEELIEANSAYAQYIRKVGDQYVLTNGALQDFQRSEEQEIQLLDEQLELLEKTNGVDLSYLDSYTAQYQELINASKALQSYNFNSESDSELFQERTQELIENAEAYQSGAISADQYFKTIEKRINTVDAGFSNLSDEVEDNVKETDLYEAQFASMAGQIAGGITDLTKAFKQGTINMDKYYSGMIAGTKASIALYAKYNKNIEKTFEGIYQVKEITEEAEYAEAKALAKQLNGWQESISKAESMIGVVDSLTNNYDYLVQYADSFGQIDFSINDNFDATSTEFQNMCQSVSEQIWGLKNTNEEAYNSILASMAAADSNFSADLINSAEELNSAMVGNAQVAEAALNSTMNEVSSTIQNSSQAIGSILSALGEVISSFDYNITAIPTQIGTSHSQMTLNGHTIFDLGIPQFTIDITGSGGESIQNLSSALANAGSYFTQAGSTSGQGGIYDYGLEPSQTIRNDILDPNSYGDIDSGSSSDPSYADKKSDSEKERYHTVTNQLEDLSAAYDEVAEAKDRAFGKDKLNAIDDEIKATEDLINKQKEYINEISTNLPIDKNIMSAYASMVLGGFQIAFDEAGNILNFDSLQDTMFSKWNTMASTYTSDSTEWEVFENQYEQLEKYIEQYEETYDLLRDEEEQYQEYLNQLIDLQLEKVQTAVELKVDVADDYLETLEYQIDKLEDSAYNAAEAIALFGEQAELIYDKIQADRQGLIDTLALSTSEQVANMIINGTFTGDLSELNLTEDQVSAIKDYRSDLISLNEELDDLRESVQDKVLDTFDEFNEKLDEGIDLFEHYQSILESYQNIVDIVGKKYLNVSNDLMKTLHQGSVENRINALKATNDTYTEMIQNQRIAEQGLADAIARGNQADITAWEETLQEIQNEVNEAQENMLSAWEEALESAAEQFENAVDLAIDNFEKALSSFDSLEELQSAYERQGELADAVLPDYEKIYELSKLQRDINNTIDDTDNIAGKQKLAKLLEKLNKYQEDGVEMSQYDLEYLQKEYELRKAEIALEEAQNAKDTVRLRRDNEGNYGYVYTANEDKVDDAQQKYEDALYAMQELSSDYIDEMSDQLIQTSLEMEEALANVRAEDYASIEEYYAKLDEVAASYQEQLQQQQDEMQKAIDNNKTLYEEDWTNYSEMTGYKISETEKFMMSYKDTILGTMMDATGDIVNFVDNINEQLGDSDVGLISELLDAYEQWKVNTDAAMVAAGTSTEDFANNMTNTAEVVSVKSQEAVTAVDTMAQQMNEQFNSIVDSVTNWQDAYSNSIDEAINDNLRMIENVNDLIAVLSGVEEQADLASSSVSNLITNSGLRTGTTIAAEIYENNGTSISSKLSDYEETLAETAETLTSGTAISNLLSTDNLGTSIIDVIDKTLSYYTSSLAAITATGFNNYISNLDQTLQQEVTIEASFPNVSDRNEIEEAFENLINTAAQYANRK